jgi:hypothetical protein
MIGLINCFRYHVLSQIVFLTVTASHHNMWCWWCYRSSVRGVWSAVQFWRHVWWCGLFCTLGGETVFCTLVGASFPAVSAGGSQLSLCDRVAPSNISAKCFNANSCSSPTLQNGPAGCGCNSAWVSSVAALVANSCVEGNGNLKFSGKKSTVSTMCHAHCRVYV